MSRKKTEINPIRAERLKILIEDTKLKQTEFAERVNFSQQHISGILHLKTALTEETAQEIVSVFPKYEIGWLLGYQDEMTQSEKFYNAILEAKEENVLLHTGFFSFAKLSDFDITTSPIESDMEIEELAENIKEYCIVSRDGKEVRFSLSELNTFENELCDYVEFRLMHLMK